MSRIIKLELKNFRGFENAVFNFKDDNVICLIGRGDSGKTTILDAINYVLSPNWKLNFYDHDFHNANIELPIHIEATIIKPPEELIGEDKFGLYLRGWDPVTKQVQDEVQDNHEEALTIKLMVEKDLQPKWFVTNTRIQEDKEIRNSDRSKFLSFIISDDLDNHFKWNEGNPLIKLLKLKSGNLEDEKLVIVDAIREAKTKIDDEPFSHLDDVISDFKTKASSFGIQIDDPNITVDFKDLLRDSRKTSLHDKKVPYRMKGKGSKRILSIALQYLLASNGGIIQIDEIEQGLEPDRVQHLVSELKTTFEGQMFITTHSQNVIIELDHSNLYLVKSGSNTLIEFETDLQACIRKHPQAFFGSKIVVCEGATELGICKALNQYRIDSGLKNSSSKGVCFVDGVGHNQISYSKAFNASKFKCAMFCDSDDDATNNAKPDLITSGIKIFDWEDRNSTEQQLFKNIPWAGLLELIVLAKEIKSEQSINDSIESKHQELYSSSANITQDNIEIRHVLGLVSGSKKWFKSVSYGILIGDIIFKYFTQLTGTNLHATLNTLSDWIDHD